jgi:NAD+ kinase
MRSKFRHVALFGKYHTSAHGGALESSRRALDDVAQFLTRQGCDVVLDQETASHTGLNQYPVLEMTEIGAQCDLGLVIGGDGTMLGIGRQMARYGLPLMGINQGRLGFITDIPLQTYQDVLQPMLQGHYQAEDRSLLQARVMRDQRCVFSALAMNDVVVNRGGTSGMVELRVEVDGHFVSTRRRSDHRHPHRLNGLFTLGRRPLDAPSHWRLGHGPDRPAHFVKPPDRVARIQRDQHRNRGWTLRQRQL